MLNVKPDRTLSINPPQGLGYDFALLGLHAREARVEEIRRAAARTAIRIQEATEPDSERAEMLGDLVSSTYRLLDPRLRSRAMERIQLSIFGESDLERQQLSRVPLLPLVGNDLSPKLPYEAALVASDEVLELRQAKLEIVEKLRLHSEKQRRSGKIAGTTLAGLCVLAASIGCGLLG